MQLFPKWRISRPKPRTLVAKRLSERAIHRRVPPVNKTIPAGKLLE
ncbi:hypothetical protein RE6C_04461 [Rhodopirellula europaea 6C]|uniref:Uncharacterized protein n=1 Tax=Rhodopirellula europaea 6C TaxID=1263867 RepID=M2AXF3_9BACT|nr:hypothetical protein RE6C_04461 [Rhodopirellula europaea 6C]